MRRVEVWQVLKPPSSLRTREFLKTPSELLQPAALSAMLSTIQRQLSRLAWRLAAHSHPLAAGLLLCSLADVGVGQEKGSPAREAAASVSSSLPPAGIYVGPVVARNQMNLILKGEVLDTIEIGDLLTVVAERESSLVIQTHSGHKGAVAKGSVVALAEAAKVYDKLIAREPKEGRLYTLRAGAYYAQGAHEKAIEDYDKAIKLGYAQPHAFTSRGLFHAALANHDAALKDFSKAIELEPKDSVSYMNRAGVYLTVGDIKKAIQDYSAAIELKPGNPVLYSQRAVAHKMSGDAASAIADYDKALQNQPDDVTSLMGRGFVKFQSGQHEAAIKDFGKVIELSPQSAVAYNNRGYNYQQLGEEIKAMQDFVRATELAPEYLLALRNRAWLATLSANNSVADPADAIDVATRVCELTQFKDFSDLLLLSAAYASATEFETAIGWQEKAEKVADKEQSQLSKEVLKLYQDKRPLDPALLEQAAE